MKCLSSERIELFHEKSINKFGGSHGILKPDDVENLQSYIAEIAAPNYGFDDIETACLAAYQIVKGHFFIDGNKRTANFILLNCLKTLGYAYTGRSIDLSRKIEDIAKTPPDQKETAVKELAYFIKARSQKATG